MINVTKCFLPPLEEYTQQVHRAFKNEWLTNRGELVLELEDKLRQYLNTDGLILTNNGTVPLQIALKLLAEGGEVITTPFSYIATTAAIIWENCTPVFVDIDPQYLTIDVTLMEAAITPKTKAILVTHVFGNPCDVEAIAKIAQKYGLKVIYDAAHAFGVTYKGESLFHYGDVSTCSFHATKLFHTGEGGAMFTQNKELFHQLYYHHNFGHNGPLAFHGLGINGKMSELQAAMGLSVLPFMASILSDRKRVCDTYDALLDFDLLEKMKIREFTQWNYSYYPVIFKSEQELLKVQAQLNESGVFPRRYFYPSLNTIEYVKGNAMPVSESIASRILCLPLYVGIESETVNTICTIINENLATA